MSNDDITELSKKIRFISNMVAAIGLLACGIIMLIFGIISDNIGFSFSLVVVPIILFTLFVSLFIVALLQKNSVSMYLAILCLICGITTILGNFDILGYDKIYPGYILAFSLASIGAMCVSHEYIFHLKFIAFFGLIASALVLGSFNLVSMTLIWAIIVIIVGLFILLLALITKKEIKELK